MSDALNQAYTDWDGWRSTLPSDRQTELDGLFRFSNDIEGDKKRFLATQYISERTGKPSQEVSENLESYYLPAYSVAQDGFKALAPLDLNAFHDRVASEIQMEQEDKRVAGDLNKVGMMAAASGVTWPDAWAAHRDANKMAGTPREGEYLQRFIEARDAYGKQIEPYKALAQSIVAESEKSTDAMASTSGGIVAQGDGDLSGVAQKLLAVPADQRPAVMEAAGLIAESKGYDRKWLAQRMGENIARATANIAEGLPRSINRDGIMMENRMIKSQLSDEIQVQDRSDEAGAALAKRYDDNLKALDLMDVQDQVDKFANEKVDSTRYEDDNLLEKGLLGVASTIPSMAAAAVPVFGIVANAGMYSNETYKQIRERNPEMSREDANAISLVAAPFMAAIDKLELDVFVKGAPWMKDSLQGILGHTVARGASRALATNVTEMVGENVQDLTPYAVQQVASVLNDNIEGVEWHKIIDETLTWDKQGELLATTILLSSIGVGGGMIKDSAKVRSVVSNPLYLKAEGFNDEQITSITELAGAGDYGGAYEATQEAFKATDFKSEEVKQRRQEASETIIARQQIAMNASAVEQKEAGVSAIVRDDAGWKIRMDDGKDFAVSSEEAAVAMVKQLAQARNQEEANTTVALVENWHSKDSGLKKETVFTGETQRSTGESITRTKGGIEIGEDTTPATIAALREQALMDAKASGNEAIDVVINGKNEFLEIVEDGVKEVIQRITVNNSASMVNTFNHEKVESTFRSLLASGKVTREETVQAIATVSPAFNPDNFRRLEDKAFAERVQRIANGQGTDVEIRETVSELATAEITGVMKDGSRVPVGEFSTAIKNAIANAKDADTVKTLGKFYQWFVSLRAQFRAIFSAVAALRLARRKGTIKEGDDYHKFIEKLLGVDVQEQSEYDRKLGKDMQDILDKENPAGVEEGGAAFSLSKITPDNPKIEEVNGITAPDIFSSAKKRHGVTRSIYEAGYVLPDGTMLDFSGKGEAGYVQGFDLIFRPSDGSRDYMKDQRGMDHREIEWEGMPEYKEQWGAMVDFLRLGAVRVDANSGMISMHSRAALTRSQESVLKALVVGADGAYLDLEDDAGNRVSMQLQSGKWGKVSGLIRRWSEGETPETENVTFSLSPGKTIEIIQKSIDENLKKNPELRRLWAEEANKRLQKLKKNWEEDRRTPKGDLIPAVEEPRAKSSLDKEEKTREAFRSDELQQAVYAQYQGVIDNADLAKIWSGPVMSHLAVSRSRLKGRLMAKGVAAKAGKVDLLNNGDYDGMDGVPPVVFGGNTMPDQMAQELFDGGLLKEPTPDALWDAIRSEVAQSRQWKEILEKSKAEIAQAKEQARAEAAEWRKTADAKQKRDNSPQKRLLRSMRILDAALSVFPPELRAKVGGFIDLAKHSTDEARVKVIDERIKKMDELLEKHLRKEYIEAIEDTLEKYTSRIGKKGAKEGRTTAEITEIADYAQTFYEMSKAKQDEEMTLIEGVFNNADSTEDDVLSATVRSGIAEIFYDARNQSAASLSDAFKWLQDKVQEGKETRKILDEARKEYLSDKTKGGVKDISGVEFSSQADADKRKNQIKGSVFRRVIERVNGYIDGALATSLQQIEWIFGEDSTTAKEFIPRIIRGANMANDIKRGVEAQRREMLSQVFGTANSSTQVVKVAQLQKPKASGVLIQEDAKRETITVPIEMLERLNDGTIDAKGIGLTNDEAETALEEWAETPGKKRSVDVVRVTNAGTSKELFISEMEAVNYLLHWNQEQVRKRMEYHGWSEKSIEQLNKFLSPESKAIAAWMSEMYGTVGYNLVSPVYRRVFNAPLPRIKNFAPSVYNRRGKDGTMSVDPSENSSGMMASFTKGRRPHNNSVSQTDAMVVFLSHFEHVAHWVANVELVRDMKAVMGSTQVKNAIITRFDGRTAEKMLQRIDNIETQGNDDAFAVHEIHDVASSLNQARVFAGLSFRISPIIKQTPALLNPLLADVPAHSYAVGLAKLMAGKIDVAEMWKSDNIARRIENGFSAEARIAMGAKGKTPLGAVAIHAMQKGMMPMQYTDAGWTAVGAAIAFDYYRGRFAKEMNPEMANAAAINAVENMIARSAQPADLVNRSLVEDSSNAFVKQMWMFASEQRKTLGIEYYAIKRLLTGRSKNKAMDVQRVLVAHFIMGLTSQIMNGIVALALGDDDDVEREWSAEEFGASLLAGPISGLFVLGDAMKLTMRYALGVRVFKPTDQGIAKAAWDLRDAVKNFDHLFSSDSEEVVKEIDKLSKSIGMVMSALIGPAGMAPDVIMGNTLRQVEQLLNED